MDDLKADCTQGPFRISFFRGELPRFDTLIQLWWRALGQSIVYGGQCLDSPTDDSEADLLTVAVKSKGRCNTREIA